MLKDFLNAISFLSVIPLKQEEIRKNSVLYFPAAGLLIGIILSTAFLLFDYLFTLNIAVILVLILYILLTGGLHLDGLADTVDGLSGGGTNKEKVLVIMSDSRIGSHGAVALICALALKFSLLAALPESVLIKVFFFIPILGRLAMLVSMYYSKPAKQEGLGTLFIQYSKTAKAFIPALLVIILSYLLFNFKGLISTAITLASIYLFTNYLSKKAGGMTGDTVGAINEASEVVFLIACLII